MGDEPQKRKLLIAVGKMGSGKSAFVKTLVCPKNSRELPSGIEKIKVENGKKSVTDECTIYPVHPSHGFVDKSLDVMDTPGLDSTSDGSFIV